MTTPLNTCPLLSQPHILRDTRCSKRRLLSFRVFFGMYSNKLSSTLRILRNCPSPNVFVKRSSLNTDHSFLSQNRKIPWRISQPQKARQRKRLRSVDNVVDTISAALARNGLKARSVDRWYREMPREEEMLPKDKYTLFDKKEKTYRKGIHSMLPLIARPLILQSLSTSNVTALAWEMRKRPASIEWEAG